MRILTAVALPACPRSISCRGSRTVSSERPGHPERGSPPRCCLGQRGGAADSYPSHPPTSECGLPYASLSGWLYTAVHGNSSCVGSGQRKKQHLLSPVTPIKMKPLPSPRQDKQHLQCLLLFWETGWKVGKSSGVRDDLD